MRVSDVKTFLVYPESRRVGVIGGKHWLFVKVETDEGIHGWGEAYTQLDRERNIEQQIHELGQYVIGRDPFNIKHFTNIVYNDFASRRGSMDLYCALSGIEQALWDILGKKLGNPRVQPVGRPLSRQGARVCQRLVRRRRNARGARRDGDRYRETRLQCPEIRPIPRPMAPLYR